MFDVALLFFFCHLGDYGASEGDTKTGDEREAKREAEMSRERERNRRR